MILRMQRHIRTSFRDILRAYFSVDPTYPWVTNLQTTKINILEFFTPQARTYPMITVEDITGDMFAKTLDRGFQETVTGLTVIDGITYTNAPLGYRHGIGREYTVMMRVRDYSPVKTAEIVDKIDQALSFYMFERFRERGIEITNMRIAGESSEQIGNDALHYVDIAVEVYAEWEEFISIEQANMLKDIVIPDYDGVVVVQPDGTTDPNFNSP